MTSSQTSKGTLVMKFGGTSVGTYQSHAPGCLDRKK